MRRVAVIALVVAGFAAVLVAAPFIVSSHLADARIAERISARTGQHVTVGGEPVVSLLPAPAVELKRVALSDPARGEPYATIPAVKVSLDMLALAAGDVAISELELVEPTFRPSAAMQRGPSGERDPDAALAWLQSAHWDALRVRDGSVEYGGAVVLDGMNLGLQRRAGSGSVELSGSFRWRGAKFALDALLETPRAMLAGGASRARIELSARTAGRSIAEGSATDGPERGGHSAAAPGDSLKALIKRLGVSVAPGTRLGPVVVDGRIATDGASWTVSEASLALGGERADGTFTARVGGGTPRLDGALAFRRLDLDAFLGVEPKALLRAIAGAPARSSWWSRVEARMSIAADRVEVGGRRLSGAAVTLVAQDGRATLTLGETGLAEGRVRGRFSLTADGARPATRLSLCFQNVSVADVAGLVLARRFDSLTGSRAPLRGTGSVALDAAAEGRSLEAVLGSLSGVAVAHVRGGSIGGVEIESTLERLSDGNTVIASGNAPFIPVTGRSAFESLRSYLVVKDGIARAARLRVDGDRYHVTLGGGGDLGRGEIEAEGVALLFESAQGGRRVDPAVRLPFGIGGTLARPMIAPGIPMVGHRPHAGRDRQRAYYDSLASPLRIASSSVAPSDGADQPGPGTRSRRTDAGTSVMNRGGDISCGSAAE